VLLLDASRTKTQTHHYSRSFRRVVLEQQVDDFGLLRHGSLVPSRREVDTGVSKLANDEGSFHPSSEREAHLEEDDTGDGT